MDTILKILNQLHFESYKLSMDIFDRYFNNAGNIGIFCQNNEEYEKLNEIKLSITEEDQNPNLKYFRLKSPIIITETKNTPKTIYTHLYIRKPDLSPYGKYRGDIDFFTSDQEYSKLLEKVNHCKSSGAVIYNQPGIGNLIQLSNPTIKTVAYISTKEISENIRVRI